MNNSGYAAEFGRSGGGVVNAVTKSGTNTFQGSGFWYFRDESMAADDPFGRPPTDFSQNQFGASLGGPVKRDKAHFFAGVGPAAAGPAVRREVQRRPHRCSWLRRPGRLVRSNQRRLHAPRPGRLPSLERRAISGSARTAAPTPARTALSHRRRRRAPSRTTRSRRTTRLRSWDSSRRSWRPTRLNEIRAQFSREDRPREPNTLDPTHHGDRASARRVASASCRRSRPTTATSSWTTSRWLSGSALVSGWAST